MLGDRARKATALLQQLQPGCDWAAALKELGNLYPHLLLSWSVTEGLSVLYACDRSSTGELVAPPLPKMLHYTASWMAGVWRDGDACRLLVSKSEIHPPNNVLLNIKQFQRVVGLTSDGVWGPHTQRQVEDYFDFLSGRRPGPAEHQKARTRWDRILGDDL